MEFDFSVVPAGDRYKLMSASITPRPIAWVTSRSAAGVANAAPFSFFNMVAADPPLVAIGFLRQADGRHKDTPANILETKEFVVNLVSEADAPAMNFTCIDAPPEFDEAAHAGLVLARSSVVAPDRIATAPVSMECRLYQAIEAGQSTIVLGEVVRFHIHDRFIDAEKLHVDTMAMGLVARMHGAGWYSRSDTSFQLLRPRYADWLAAQITAD
ncbi:MULTISPECIES: flavin reductase family protein [unclassified Novosphingobium]|uniref:flavin reductase family protein n=1 Tax=unclassified Novosphingobium TaxID=2644732 RepID=UPI00146F712A|nr:MULTISPECIES: flavin reductase family protein [unclassified Novosphingobium]NMN03775.1 flavin reductase (DIM6/NTAB) family NADH-FMN oxidoreductase RutF [Novosphingobium sp. SG919]NMN86235.1 flavin reductase (DIM6/NTAB) family NADH-FMN oxidoreductase RutF [Novosphingobium sp. SG916]